MTLGRNGRACSAQVFSVLTLTLLFFTAIISQDVLAQRYEAWPSKTSHENPKLQKVLDGLITEARAGRAITPILSTLQDNAGGAFLDRYVVRLQENLIQVVIEGVSPESAKGIEEAVASFGGQVEVTFESLVQALIPMDRLEEITARADVSYVRLPVRAKTSESDVPTKSAQPPSTGSFVTEGKAAINALAWHEAGFTGEGVKVGVDDAGYRGYTGLLGRELPPRERVITRSFRSDRDIECRDCSATEQEHGLAVAEIIYDLAPGATFYLVNAATDVENKSAITYLIGQDVDVINTSWGFPSGCFRNGGGIFESQFEQARNAGITWAASAGNNADVHWEGNWIDNNQNNQVEFSGGDETFTLNAEFFGATIEGEQVAAVGFFFIFSWDAPCTGATDDYEIEIYPKDEPDFVQEGDWYWSPGVPIKFVGGIFFIRNPSLVGQVDVWNIVIKKKRQDAADARLDLILSSCLDCTGGDNYFKESGSVSIFEPSISANVISAGAVHQAPARCPRVYCPDGNLLFYSSRGPTKDLRRKPDIAAPSHVSTSAFGRFTGHASTQNDGFGGTSASSPHVAGAAALVIGALRAKGEVPTPDDVRTFLIERAEDLGSNGPDNLYGAGLLNLGQPPTVPPSIIAIEPNSGLQGATLDASISGTGLAGATSVTFSGSGVSATIGEGGGAGTLPITITITADAEPGERTFSVVALGGTVESGDVLFTVQQAPQIAVEPGSLSFTATASGDNPASQTLHVTNTGGSTLNWQAAISADAPWLSLTATEGTAPSDVDANINIADLAAGTYEGQITFTGTDATNNPVIVAVTLTISEAGPKPLPFSANPDSLTFEAKYGGENPGSQSLQITNNGQTVISWTVVKLEPFLGGDPTWLDVDTERASSTLESGATTTVVVSVNISGIKVGSQKALLFFNAEGYESLAVHVTLNVAAPEPEGELIALVFTQLEFVTADDWERTLRDGCVVYKDISGESSLVRVTLPDESVVEYEIPADHEVIVCGDVVHIDTRTQPPVPVEED